MNTLLQFFFINHKHEGAVRRVIPNRIWFGVTEYHPKPQWFLNAFDVDKQAERDFPLSDINIAVKGH